MGLLRIILQVWYVKRECKSGLDKCVEQALHFSGGVAVASLACLLDAEIEPISGMLLLIGFRKRLPELLIGGNALFGMIVDQGL